MKKTVSVVISARNEFPNIVHTVHSIFNDLETFLKPKDFEIIIVDNNSDDSDEVKRAVTGTSDFLRCRGMYANGVLRLLYDPIAGNVSARNKGAKIAQGEYLFFSDAHMSYAPGTFERLIKTIDETDGIVHPALSWMGAYPPEKGMSYSWKLGEEFKGTWNNYSVTLKDWFYVPAMGHACLGMRRKQFLEFLGYPDYLRCYGGGEVFLDTKWWMLGKPVVTEPRVNAYHLSAARGYSYVHDDYIHNVFHSAIILGADMWAERTFLNYSRRASKEVLSTLWKQAEGEAVRQRTWLEEHRIKTFNEVIAERPWDVMNDAKHGSHNSGMLIYHQTWLDLIKGTPVEELYNNSKHQKELAEFVEKNLSQFTYKR